MKRICLIGLGEVGALFAHAWHGRYDLQAWDTQFADADSKPTHARNTLGLPPQPNAALAAANADMIVSAVTAAQTVNAATDAAKGLKPGALFLDLNSASPTAKISAAAIINDAGGEYVEAAVMAPIGPKGLATPLLLGGPHARAFASTAHDLGLAGATFYSDAFGRASAAKLCRSVVVKGVEALLLESLLAARHYGVEQDVVNSLSNILPGPDWPELSRYMISRAIEHGARRAEEMREAARTVADAGLSPLMSDACAARQDWAAEQLAGVTFADLDALLSESRTRIEPLT